MNSHLGGSFSDLPNDRMLLINQRCNAFELELSRGKRPRIEDYLEDLSEREWTIAIREMLPIEIEYRGQSDAGLNVKQYLSRFPEIDSEWLSTLLAQSRDGSTRQSQHVPAPTEIPDRIGDYDIVEPLGQGGMGTVYRAVHRRMHRTVALKILRGELAIKESMKRRFEREVRAAGLLVHPNIVTAYDAGEEDGLLYLVTEFVDGQDLSECVRTRGPLAWQSAMRFILDVATGLEYAHGKQVIHRDIKPANLLLDESGRVKILDMGLARLGLDDLSEDGQSELTQTGTIMGTAAYMAPEQARDTRTADERSDIYSLGCVFYFLLSGRPVFQGETVIDTILAHATRPTPSLASRLPSQQIPEQVDAIFQKMIAKNPADRYPSVKAIARRPAQGDR
ncbi:MAG: serine/threonine-protein kinase [Pirellulaceae bacterium]